jgi:SET domain
MAEEEEDPFGAFGEDSDSDSDNDSSQDNKNESSTYKKYQDKLKYQDQDVPSTRQHSNNSPNKGTSPAATAKKELGEDVTPHQRVHPKDLAVAAAATGCSLDLSSWPDPVYMSAQVKAVASLDTMGGSRGLVALVPLPPGTLVLIESPLMIWPEEQLGQPLSLLSFKWLLQQDHADKIVACLEDFHPTKATVDKDYDDTTKAKATSDNHHSHQVTAMMQSLHHHQQQQHHQQDEDPLSLVEQLVRMANKSQKKKLRNRNGTPITTHDLYRIYLALRYNGLESGLYCYMALLNHHCQPNCVKFLPQHHQKQQHQQKEEEHYYSEVRTTRWITPGECLTISYLPRIACHATRRHYLWEQHRFDIGVLPSSSSSSLLFNNNNNHCMEVVQGQFPESSTQFRDQDTVTFRLEKSLEEMNALYHSTKDALSSSSSSPSGQGVVPVLSIMMDMVEQAKALELSSLELYQEARQQLQNDRHILLLPCLILHMDACHLILETNDANNNANNNHHHHDGAIILLNHKQRCMLLGRMIVTGMELLELQRGLYGDDHFDVARTNLDLSQAIQDLLANSPDTLLHLVTATSVHSTSHDNNNDNHPKTFRDWSTLEYQYRRQHERIKALYPRDAHKYIPKAS